MDHDKAAQQLAEVDATLGVPPLPVPSIYVNPLANSVDGPQASPDGTGAEVAGATVEETQFAVHLGTLGMESETDDTAVTAASAAAEVSEAIQEESGSGKLFTSVAPPQIAVHDDDEDAEEVTGAVASRAPAAVSVAAAMAGESSSAAGPKPPGDGKRLSRSAAYIAPNSLAAPVDETRERLNTADLSAWGRAIHKSSKRRKQKHAFNLYRVVEEAGKSKKIRQASKPGTVLFETTAKHQKKSAPFCRIANDDSPKTAVSFLHSQLSFRFTSGYPRPSLILSVTGGARSFTLPRRLEEVVRTGLLTIADKTNAWVITGGTHSGVMKLVGQMMSKIENDQDIFTPPVIGIATWGVIEDRDKLSGDQRFEIPYASRASSSLDHNHSFFFLVDDGTEKEFGKEIDFRGEFEREASTKFDAPVVTIVIQGGPGTLKTAYVAVTNGTPIIVVDGSGLAADVLAYAYNFLHSSLSKYSGYTIDDLKIMIAKAFNATTPERVNALLQQTLDSVDNPNLVHVYNIHDSVGQSFESIVLKAVFKSGVSLKNKLRQAMFFESLDVARQELSDAMADTEKAKEIPVVVNDNLMSALLHNQPAFVNLYMEYGAHVCELKPTRKEFVDAERDRSEIDKKGYPAFLFAISQLYYEEALKDSYVKRLLAPNTDITREHCEVHRVEGILARFLDSKFKFERSYLIEWQTEGFTRKKEDIATHSLFLWAICLDKFRMAAKFWKEGNESIPNALIAKTILSSLSKHPAVQGPHLVDERQKMKHNSVKFEKLATGVLDECHSTDSNVTGLMLHEPIGMFGKKNAIQVAFEAESLEFLAHAATQSAINSDWHGAVPERRKMLLPFMVLFFFIWFPVRGLFQLCCQTSRKSKADEGDDESVVVVPNSTRSAGVGDSDDDDDWLDADEHVLDEMTDEPRKKQSTFALFKATFRSPITRFVTDLLAHLALCFAFSFYVVTDIGSTIQPIEIIFATWFGALLVEEGRQSLDGLKAYVRDTWNWLDLTFIFLFFGGFICRCIDPPGLLIPAKTLHSIASIFIWLRFLRYYAVSEFLGPKLIMMSKMSKDVLAFVFLLAIFLLGYGVAAQGILFPSMPFSGESMQRIVMRPYFQVYGELFLDDIESESDCIGNTPFYNCGYKTAWLVPGLLALYILVTNILLVNLLIAMFNDTYIKVQEKSNILWRRQNYELFQEYRDKPVLPGPFLLLVHLYLIATWLFKQCCGKDNQGAGDQHAINEKNKRLDKLQRFQERNTDRFIAQEGSTKNQTLEARLEHNESNVNSVLQHLTTLTEHMTALRAAVDLLSSAGFGGGNTTGDGSAGSTEAVDDIEHQRTQAALLGHQHISVKSAFYKPPPEYPVFADDPPVQRATIPDDKLDPRVEYVTYEPVEYTSSSVLKSPVWADPLDPSSIPFNTMQQTPQGAIDRTSVKGEFPVVAGTPINPFGRTGIIGRGVLGRWGCNLAADTVVTRWRRSSSGAIFKRDGKQVLEFLAIQRPNNGPMSIPGGFVDPGEDMFQTQGREFAEKVFGAKLVLEDKETSEALQELFTRRNRVEIKRIYCEDWRNTDNAWIETVCVNFHDSTGRVTSKLRVGDGCRWMVVHSGLSLFASHTKLLELVANARNAYF
eukprot:m.358873 g.358873  ORF g.358873 m.358873 type:complete len:1618 (-) comp18327_c0_seq1:37-4890(-)